MTQTDQTIVPGEYVAVSPKEGWRAGAGVVINVVPEGFWFLPLPASPDAPISAAKAVEWRGVASIKRLAPPETLVRMYHGKQQADTAASFQRESEVLGQAGYRPTTQSWGQGQWGCGAWLVALALCILLIGILVFLYMVIVHPDGTLTVTYAKSAMAPVADVTAAIPFAPTQAPSAALTLSERLTQLDEARAAGLLTPEEYEAKRAALLESL